MTSYVVYQYDVHGRSRSVREGETPTPWSDEDDHYIAGWLFDVGIPEGGIAWRDTDVYATPWEYASIYNIPEHLKHLVDFSNVDPKGYDLEVC